LPDSTLFPYTTLFRSLVGHVKVLLRCFAGNVSIYPESDCRFHHALGPACAPSHRANRFAWVSQYEWFAAQRGSNTRTQFFERAGDRKSTRLNSSHVKI